MEILVVWIPVVSTVLSMMPVQAPKLMESAQRLKSIIKTNIETSSKEIAEVYVAAIGLLTLLKKDKATLNRWSQDGKSECPPPDEIPAISLVLHDKQLFEILLFCLKSGGTTTDASVTGSDGAGSRDAAHQVSRKRSLSLSGETPKTIKATRLAHHVSPVPTRVQKNMNASGDAKSHQPSLNLPVLAGAILSIALAHLDHWPAILVDVYAVDCFGARLWVDEPACALLVKNLRLAHQQDEQQEQIMLDDSIIEDSRKMRLAYREFQVPNDPNSDAAVTKTKEPFKRRPSLGLSSAGSNMERGAIERSVSTESVDPEVRAQMPYEAMDIESIMADDAEQLIVSATPSKLGRKGNTKKRDSNDSDSSSSGGEDEQVVALSESNDGDSDVTPSARSGIRTQNEEQSRSTGPTVPKRPTTEGHYPLTQNLLRLELVRQRFFGDNLALTHDFIERALTDRVEQKSRQNSGLLQALPNFTSVPQVRRIATQNLEKWLQSPALAGLARKLFADIVSQMENIDPPLPDDLNAINAILRMKLKANQFTAHLENLTAIASRIPTQTVGQNIYTSLLRQCLVPDTPQGTTSDAMKMIGGVHNALPTSVSYDALAASLLVLLVEGESSDTSAIDGTQVVKEHIIQKLGEAIRSLSKSFGAQFDFFNLLEALLSMDVNTDSWTTQNEEDKARLMFQCITLHVAASASTEGLDEREKREVIRKSIHKTRKSLLSWCCSEYGPRWSASRTKRKGEDSNNSAGAGIPNFQSALGPIEEQESIPTWLNTMRCLLFIEEANSELMDRFLAPLVGKIDDQKVLKEVHDRIQACCSYGADIDDGMIRIVLESSASDSTHRLPPEMALQLLEHIFESCGRTRGTSLRVSDPDLVWEMYDLAQYIPPSSLLSEKDVGELSMNISHDDQDGDGLPRLAYPGIWWRVTMLGLIMCGAAPKSIGEVIWKDHPTLRALIKMVTSAKYRFPTVDCDEVAKELMKGSESSSRELETKVAELLFLPPKKPKDSKTIKMSGSRVSRRIRKQQEEREAAAALAESSRRRKMLKSAQKSIMLWDPDGPARKPPRESAQLLLSVENMFDLSSALQKCIEPDFLLMTIGQTSRGAIERAYAWLIPIISKLPEIIFRLPSSTSCFLLLRAYSSDSENKSQLKQLLAPLLAHVKDCLRGKHGQEECIKAFDLLMSDVATHNAEKRKSARRVLHDSLGSLDNDSIPKESSSWMLNVLKVDHAKFIVESAIEHMSKAASYERGKVLKSIILSLKEHIHFAQQNGLGRKTEFSALLTSLISKRQSVYAEAFDTYPEFRELAVNVIHTEIKGLAEEKRTNVVATDNDAYAKLWLNIENEQKEIRVSLDLLKSVCVLLSICTLPTVDERGVKGIAAEELVRLLLEPCLQDNASEVGFAGSKLADGSNDHAIAVESWIMLCKAKDETVGKKAALALPEEFLARLLMSSGLPKASLMVMIDRLGNLGEKADEKSHFYGKLLLPSASSEWDIGRIGKQNDVVRRLVGRLSAYLRSGYIDDNVSMVFVDWLFTESAGSLKKAEPAKTKKKKPKIIPSSITLDNVTGLIKSTRGLYDSEISVPELAPAESLDNLDFFADETMQIDSMEGKVERDAKVLIEEYLSEGSPQKLDLFLKGCVGKNENDENVGTSLYQAVDSQDEKESWMLQMLLKWFPILSREDCPEDLIKSLLSARDDKSGIPMSTASAIVEQCALLWSAENLWKTSRWILRLEAEEFPGYSPVLLLRLLVAGVSKSSLQELSESESSTLCRISLLSLEGDTNQNITWNDRAHLPDSLAIVLDLANTGKKQFMLVGGVILQRLGQLDEGGDSSIRGALSSAFLRLYLLRPQWASTGSAQVRNVLLTAAQANARFWSSWVSTMDDQFDDLLEALATGEARVIKSFHEQSRKYPLLVLRKSERFVQILQSDAHTDREYSSASKVVGQQINGPVAASFDGRLVQVTIRDWGYQYTESVWLGVLDILSSIPKEVLYFSGQKLGVLSILEVTLHLIRVQGSLTSASSAAKIKSKVADMIATYQSANLPGFHAWLATVTGGIEVRNMLTACGLLSPEEAIQSLKQQKENNN